MIESVDNVLNRIQAIRQKINSYYSFGGVQASSFKEILDELEDQKLEQRAESREGTSYQLPTDLAQLIEKYARASNLDPDLVKAVIKVESNFNPMAISRAGAKGLMQLMPETAKELGVVDIFDPEENIAGGTRYLRQMLDQFNNDLPMALAAYNAGPGRVMKGADIPNIPETQNYVKKVLSLYKG